MEKSKLIMSIVIMAIGTIFFFNNKKIGKGAFKFYRMLYTKKNLIIMFKILGVFLILGGLALLFLG